MAETHKIRNGYFPTPGSSEEVIEQDIVHPMYNHLVGKRDQQIAYLKLLVGLMVNRVGGEVVLGAHTVDEYDGQLSIEVDDILGHVHMKVTPKLEVQDGIAANRELCSD